MINLRRFMLKSLGQWTASCLKPRSVVPSQVSLPSKIPPSNKTQEEPTAQKNIEFVATIIKK